MYQRGGPVPKERPTSQFHTAWQPLGYVSNWGGMEIGSNMMYPNQVIDGIVHRLGGNLLRQQCLGILQFYGKDMTSLPLGTTFITRCKGIPDLESLYDFILHTIPPFYQSHDSCNHGTESSNDPRNQIELLKQCYTSSFSIIDDFYRFGGFVENRSYLNLSLWKTIRSWMNRKINVDEEEGDWNDDCKHFYNSKILRIGIPLIGAGARGFPTNIAIHVAASQSVSWMMDCGQTDESHSSDEVRQCILAFGIPDPYTADCLVEEIRQHFQRY